MRELAAACVILGGALGGAILSVQSGYCQNSPVTPLASPPANGRAADTSGPPVPVIATRQTSFAIPFAIDSSAGKPLEVRLYVSTDRGATWRLHASRWPSEGRFYFRASGDGEYWFASRTSDVRAPGGALETMQPELRVSVDTTAPRMEFSVSAGAAGEVRAAWRVFDEQLAPETLRLAYQAGPGQSWRPVAVKVPGGGAATNLLADEVSWRPEAPASELTVRCEVLDKAGNAAVLTRRVSAETASVGGQHSDQPNQARPIPPDPYTVRAPASQDSAIWPLDASSRAATPPDAAQSGGAQRNESLPRVQPNDRLASGETAAGGPGPSAPDGALLRPASNRVVPDGSGNDGPPAVHGRSDAQDAAPLPPGEQPRMTNSRRFQLEYDVESVGPAGVAEVELWATADGGRSWTRWGKDPDGQSPMEAVVEQEGVYGFRVVIVGRNGLAGRPPRSGDLADVWVSVDVTKPIARLTSATYGAGEQAGQLDIRWEAQDAHLASEPVTLLFSGDAGGPWTTIASGLANTGRYHWPIDSRVPREIYLRLEVRDQAGNVGQDQLAEPISIEGLTPQGRIRQLVPAGEYAPRAARIFRRK